MTEKCFFRSPFAPQHILSDVKFLFILVSGLFNENIIKCEVNGYLDYEKFSFHWLYARTKDAMLMKRRGCSDELCFPSAQPLTVTISSL